MRRPGDRAQAALLVAPYALGVALLVAIPAVLTFGLAFFEYDLLTAPSRFGLHNFEELVDDPVFHRALTNSLILVAIAVPLRLAAALAAALLLHARARGMRLHRTAAYLPTVVPDAAYALLWLYLLNPLYGPVNTALGGAGLPEPEWFTSSAGAMAVVILMLVFTIGEGFVVALAARQEVPDELYDVARLEGSSPVHTLRRLTLPLMAPVLGLLAARDTALVLQASFVPALLVTGTGPDRATLFLPNLVYDNAFENLRYGYAASMTLTMFVLTAAIVLVQQRVLRRWRVAALS